MSFTDCAGLRARVKHELPPTAPLPAALQTLACRRWPLGYLERCRARYGSRFTVYPLDMPPLIFLSDPQDIRALFAAPATVLHPGVGGAVVAPLFGESSFMLREESEHSCGRKAVLPAFHRKKVQEQAEATSQLVEREAASWPLDTDFPIHPHLQSLTLRVTLRAVFALEGDVLEELHARMLRLLTVMASLVLQEPRLRRLPAWRGIWRRLICQRRAVDELIFSLIRARRRMDRVCGDLLELLLAAHNPDGSPMSDRQVRDNLVSVLIAGHETTASALAWAFQLLAHNPAVQERLVEELAGASTGDYLASEGPAKQLVGEGTVNQPAGEHPVNQLVGGGPGDYLLATVNEVLRHRPVFLFAAPRAVAQPIEIGGWTYRPPAQLLGCIYLMHHDPALYPDPHEFRPERFLDAPPPPRVWLPWGGGRKRCIGQHLAMLQMQTVLCTVLPVLRVLPVRSAIERARWRTVLVTPHAGSRIILCRRKLRGQRRAVARERATV